MADPARAIFLSYASQDAQAAQRICDGLRAGGLEVWFDRSELRGGEAWDRTIRQQIHDCTLFLPLISAHSQARLEGYFRREWKLAVDRSHDMAEEKAFLVPVVIDDTTEQGASVPEKFRDVQWIHLPGAEATPAFVQRIGRLLSGESAVTARVPALQAPARRHTARLYGAAAAVAALAVLGYFGVQRLTQHQLAADGPSIAVLPLANESGDASQQYFSDGISEDLITALSQFQGLKVIGRSSAFKFRDSKEDSRSIGSKLGVAHLLEGSVRKSGDTIRVSAELIDAADGSTQWSQRYDRPYKDLFTLQDEITHAVAAALRTRLLPGEHAAQQSEHPPGGSLEAYDAMLQARFHAQIGSEADIRKAIEYNEQAIALDPGYALAWSNLSIDWIGIATRDLSGTAAQAAYAKARAAAGRALELAPDLAQAHIARGDVLQWADFNWRGAESEYRRALELAPDLGRTQITYALARATLGELEPAVELTRQALRTDPLRAAWYDQLAVQLTALNRLDEAERALRKAIELQPSVSSHYELLTVVEVQRGNAQAALAAAQKVPAGIRQEVTLTFVRQIGTDRAAADAALKALIAKYPDDAAMQIAEVYALRNDGKATFEWLDRAWHVHDPGVSEIYFSPFVVRYKGDPDFAAFCRKIGLPVPGESSRDKTA